MRYVTLGITTALLLLTVESLAAEDPEKAFESAFGQEARQVSATPFTKDDAAFAVKLLQTAKMIKEDPALVAVMYEKTYEFGAKNPAGYEAAIEAAGLLAELVPQRKGEWRENALALCQLDYRSLAKGPDEKKKSGERLVKQMMLVAEQRLAAGKSSEAAGLYRQASSVDSAIQGDHKEQIQAAQRFAETRQPILSQVEQAKARLQAKPDDKVAAADLVRLYLVELDNPQEAASYTDTAGDEAMKKYVLVAGMNVENLPENGCLELAKWYASLVDGATVPAKPRMLGRAMTYYERYLEVHTAQDAGHAAAKMGLDRVTAELEKLCPTKFLKEIVVEALVDGDSEFWITPKSVYWKELGTGAA
ncbi:MAG: hypothetical protein NTY65_16400, partial [Planctomycetota bacterium]|nr:hypothetical protein [Planctomycetota bacterium]